MGSNVEKQNSPSDAELKRVFGAILNDPSHKGVYNVRMYMYVCMYANI